MSNSRVAAFGSTRRKGVKPENDPSLDALLRSDVKVAVIFGKSWLLHVEEVLRCTAEENLDMISETVEYLRGHGMDVIFDAEHFFDGFKENPDYALEVVRRAYSAGARVIVLCDTNGGTLPTQLREITKTVKHEVGCPLGIHTHNDSGVAVANTLAAVEEGARHVQGTINGLGERCGNADLCQVIPNLALKMGYSLLGGRARERLRSLTALAHFVEELSGRPLPKNHPYVGRYAFAHKGGVHIDAMLKHPRTYEHIDPSLVGNERIISISELAGKAALQHHAQRLGIGMDKQAFAAALDEVKRLEAMGYHLEPADATVSLILLRSIGYEPSYFKVRTWWVETLDIGKLIARAIVSLDINGEAVTETGEGVGPVHALDEAVRNAILRKFPELKDTTLVNYKVTVIDTRDGTAAAVRVFTEFKSGESQWATTAVSRNIVEASLKAVMDGYTYRLATLRQDWKADKKTATARV